MHSKHSINSSIKIILEIKTRRKSSTRKLPGGRLWEHPDVHQTCPVTDSRRRSRTGSLSPALPVHPLPSAVIIGHQLRSPAGSSSNAGATSSLAAYTLCVSSDRSVSWAQERLSALQDESMKCPASTWLVFRASRRSSAAERWRRTGALEPPQTWIPA